MFYAILKPRGRQYFLMVAFRYAAERATFCKFSEFTEISSANAQRLSNGVARLCYGHDRLVFDQNGCRVAYLKSLYKGAAEQAPKAHRR